MESRGAAPRHFTYKQMTQLNDLRNRFLKDWEMENIFDFDSVSISEDNNKVIILYKPTYIWKHSSM